MDGTGSGHWGHETHGEFVVELVTVGLEAAVEFCDELLVLLLLLLLLLPPPAGDGLGKDWLPELVVVEVQ